LRQPYVLFIKAGAKVQISFDKCKKKTKNLLLVVNVTPLTFDL